MRKISKVQDFARREAEHFISKGLHGYKDAHDCAVDLFATYARKGFFEAHAKAAEMSTLEDIWVSSFVDRFDRG